LEFRSPGRATVIKMDAQRDSSHAGDNDGTSPILYSPLYLIIMVPACSLMDGPHRRSQLILHLLYTLSFFYVGD